MLSRSDFLRFISSVYKPLLRNSTVYTSGTYIDSEFRILNMTPLRDDLEYNLDLDCKTKLSENETFEVLNMDPEKQMCMVDVNGTPVDLFGIIRQLIGYVSPSLDVMWIGSSGSGG